MADLRVLCAALGVVVWVVSGLLHPLLQSRWERGFSPLRTAWRRSGGIGSSPGRGGPRPAALLIVKEWFLPAAGPGSLPSSPNASACFAAFLGASAFLREAALFGATVLVVHNTACDVSTMVLGHNGIAAMSVDRHGPGMGFGARAALYGRILRTLTAARGSGKPIRSQWTESPCIGSSAARHGVFLPTGTAPTHSAGKECVTFSGRLWDLQELPRLTHVFVASTTTQLHANPLSYFAAHPHVELAMGERTRKVSDDALLMNQSEACGLSTAAYRNSYALDFGIASGRVQSFLLLGDELMLAQQLCTGMTGAFDAAVANFVVRQTLAQRRQVIVVAGEPFSARAPDTEHHVILLNESRARDGLSPWLTSADCGCNYACDGELDCDLLCRDCLPFVAVNNAPVQLFSRLQRVSYLHSELQRIADADKNSMGHSGNVDQTLANFLVVHDTRGDTHTVCEIGFNVGHSAATFLTALPHVTRYIAFDVVWASSVTQGMTYLQEQHRGTAFELVKGESQVTVPVFAAAHPGLSCDVFHIDGGHNDGVPAIDFENVMALVSVGSIVMFDDCDCNSRYCVEPTQVFEGAIAAGRLERVPFAKISYQFKGTCVGIVAAPAAR
jgi:hypothetical protein